MRESSGITVRGSFVDYKYFWAQRNVQGLNLQITPLGVSGVLIIEISGKKFMVFAKRTTLNLQYQGYYELIPSGGIEDRGIRGKINYYDYLKDELYEEAGIESDRVKSISTLGLLYDTRDKVYDIGCVIQTDCSEQEVLSLMKRSSEYESVEFVNAKRVKNFIADNKDRIVPSSMGLIEMFGVK
jgi:hypothetical protein